MHEIHITLKSFESYYIEKNAVFLEKIYLLLNKNLHKMLPANRKQVLRSGSPAKNNQFQATGLFGTRLPHTSLNLPKKRKLFTVLRGVHIDKKSREQFHFTHCKKKLYMPLNNKQLFLFLFIIKNAYFYGVEIEISICYTSVFETVVCKKQTVTHNENQFLNT